MKSGVAEHGLGEKCLGTRLGNETGEMVGGDWLGIGLGNGDSGRSWGMKSGNGRIGGDGLGKMFGDRLWVRHLGKRLENEAVELKEHGLRNGLGEQAWGVSGVGEKAKE